MDACERLRARIAEREERRERIKLTNRVARKVCKEHGIKQDGYYWQTTDEEREAGAKALAEVCRRIEATKREIEDLASGFQHGGAIGYQPYVLSSLGAKIRRDMKRLARLEVVQAQRARVAEHLAKERAAEEAGAQ